jgi:hypothetical protein
VRAVANILVRQVEHAGDIDILATALRATLSRDGLKKL